MVLILEPNDKLITFFLLYIFFKTKSMFIFYPHIACIFPIWGLNSMRLVRILLWSSWYSISAYILFSPTIVKNLLYENLSFIFYSIGEYTNFFIGIVWIVRITWIELWKYIKLKKTQSINFRTDATAELNVFFPIQGYIFSIKYEFFIGCFSFVRFIFRMDIKLFKFLKNILRVNYVKCYDDLSISF